MYKIIIHSYSKQVRLFNKSFGYNFKNIDGFTKKKLSNGGK